MLGTARHIHSALSIRAQRFLRGLRDISEGYKRVSYKHSLSPRKKHFLFALKLPLHAHGHTHSSGSNTPGNTFRDVTCCGAIAPQRCAERERGAGEGGEGPGAPRGGDWKQTRPGCSGFSLPPKAKKPIWEFEGNRFQRPYLFWCTCKMRFEEDL